MITIEQLVLLISRVMDALKREGYQPCTMASRVLVNKVLREFNVLRLADLPADQYQAALECLETWEPSATAKFRLRDYRVQ